MFEETIIFQLPTHYLPKVALRLECLYQTIRQAGHEIHPVIHHDALKNLLEILTLIEKPELKSRFLKELMRIEHSLYKTATDNVNPLQESLYHQIHILAQVSGRFGGEIHQDPFLQSLRISQSTHSNDCEMHSPQLLLWLESKPSLRQADIKRWLLHLDTLQSTVNLYLALLRDSAEFKKIEMHNGFYQRPLPPKASCHLVLLRMEKIGVVPRMQLGHHGLSLRLCEMHSLREIRDTSARLDLAICQL